MMEGGTATGDDACRLWGSDDRPVVDGVSASTRVKPTPACERPGRCKFYIDRKRRYCNMMVSSSKRFCTEHAYLNGDVLNRKRIPCPLDSKHSCYEDQLSQHLKKCNARDSTKPVYYVHNINSGRKNSVDESSDKLSLTTADFDEVVQLISKVKLLYEERVEGTVGSEVLFHSVLRAEADEPMNGCNAQKHIQQQASLIGHMEKLGHLADGNCFIEFGAGRGGLSHWVQLAAKELNDTCHILVDRGSNRYKMDSLHLGEEQGPTFERIKIDIAHLDLGKVPSLQETNRPIIGMGKHLCGAATDLMLRCLLTAPEGNAAASSAARVRGVVLAVCCHHRCEWQSYVGRDLLAALGVSRRQFRLLCRLTSWAVCGTKATPTANHHDNENETETNHQTDGDNNLSRFSDWPAQQRQLIGYQCKRLLDHGRVDWLRRRGYDARMLHYVDRTFSLENVAIMATARSDTAQVNGS